MLDIDNTQKHYIPRFYLRGFCGQGKKGKIPHIYVFDKKALNKGIDSRSIEKIEKSKDAYSIYIDNFNKQRESVWGDIFNHLKDTSTAELNELIADREQSAPLREWLADFVTSISMRSRGRRVRDKEMLLDSWHSLQKGINGVFEGMDDVELAEDTGSSKEEIKRIVMRSMYADDYEKWLAVTLPPSFSLGDGTNKLLTDGSWRFENPPNQRKLILSDIPSTTLRLGPEHPNWIYFQVAISETLSLVGYCGDARQESGLELGPSQMSEEMVDLRNAGALRDSGRFVYSSSKEEIARAIE